MLWNKLLSVLVLSSAILTNAQADDIQLGQPGYGGTGCPAGSVSATLSPDNKSLSLIFDGFVAEAGPSSRRTIDRKTCNLAIPLHVPHGLSVSIIAVDYRGYIGLPSNRASATFSAEYFFAGAMGPRISRNFYGPTDQEYLFQNVLGLQAAVWSPCGADVNMRVNSSMLVRNSGPGDALASVDSADISAGLIYQLAWRTCM